MRADLELLEEALGHHFGNREILDRALTHRSHVNERLAADPALAATLRHNEQLEFLGDAILGFLVSEALLQRFPHAPEGRLSKMKAHLVSASHLSGAAQQLGLGQFLQIGRGEEMTGGREKPTLLGDSLEALLAALYLDGGMDVARRAVERWVLGETASGEDSPELEPIVDFKSALLEVAQARKLPQPRYLTIRERGPEHSKTFTVEVRVGKDIATVQADGPTKKSAAQRAARRVYEELLQAPGSRNPPRLDYPTLSLEQVYGAITFYLANKEEVERDMAERRRIEEEVIKAQPLLPPELQQKLERAREQMLSQRS